MIVTPKKQANQPNMCQFYLCHKFTIFSLIYDYNRHITKEFFIMNLEQRKANMIYEIASLIKDDPDTAPVLIEELVEIMFDEQIDHLEDVIVNHFGVEVYPE